MMNAIPTEEGFGPVFDPETVAYLASILNAEDANIEEFREISE